MDQIWVGASGINGGGGTQWGGANVYVSIDNVTYSQVAVLTAPLRQGFLTASSSRRQRAGIRSTRSPSILAESGGTLAGTSQAAAQQGATLSIVDGEFLAYETATLVSGNAYNLTGLARGLGGSTPAAHSTGAPFARIDGAVIQYTLPANFAGQTLYLKFQSFNVFGGGAEDLSTCTVYTFVASAVLADPIFAQLQTGFALDLGQVTAAPTVADDFGSVTAAPISTLDLGSVAVTVTHPIAVQLLSGTALDLGLTTSAVTVSDDFGSTNDAVVDVIDLGTV